MDKIELGTPEGTAENIDKIAELFPQVMTEVENGEGTLERTVDFDALRDLLGDVAEGQRERYQFTWPGKREAKAEARRPIYKTMIPEPGKSKDWDTTENLYIEGDNLDALKILKETYAGKVKLIYIDPPYNTGHDFVYDDDFAKTRVEYDAESGEYDEEGGRLVANTEGNGRFHSDWCSMMYPRLLLARDLLAADGAIFVSIDDNEATNMRLLCNEIYGESNFVAALVWQKTLTRRNDARQISTAHDYILVYAKSAQSLKVKPEPPSEKQRATYTNRDSDPRGDWLAVPFHAPNIRPNLTYPIVLPSGRSVMPPKGRCWSTSKENFDSMVADNRIWFGKDGDGMPQRKKYWAERGEDEGIVPWTWWSYEFAGENREATKEVKRLFDEAIVFSAPKPTKLILRILNLLNTENSVVLDFFSGSGTTAEAVMRANEAYGGRRRFIMVQLPERCDQGTVAYGLGYKTICDLGEERIRRSGEIIAADIDKENMQLELGVEPKPYPDLGFRVLRIDSSNFKDFYLTPGETSQESLFGFADNVKEGRSDLDLLFEVLPKLGIPYSAKIEERMLAGKKVFFVDGDKLAACFDANVGSDTIEEMAKAKPWYAVIRDSSMADDATHANYEELFRTYSPDTVPQVI